MTATHTGRDARIGGDGQLVVVDRLVDHQLVGIGGHHRRLLGGDHARFRGAGIKGLGFRVDNIALFAEAVPHGEPFDHVVGAEAELAVGGIERLAALAEPVVEHRLGARTVGEGLHGTGGLEGFTEAFEIGIGPGIVRGRFANGLEGRLVDQGCHRVGAQRDAVELAVDLAAVLDRDGLIDHVAGNPRGRVDDQRLGFDRPVEQPRDLRGLGGHGALDLARLALDEIGAFKVALDLAVDVQVDAGGDIAGDDDVRSEDRKGRMTRAGRHLSGHCGRQRRNRLAVGHRL